MNRLVSLIFFFLFFSSTSFAQPGANDPTFNPTDIGFGNGDGANNDIQVIVKQQDGKTLIGGLFTLYNGVAKNGIARLNNDGTIDTSFNIGTGSDGYIYALAIQPDGKILIGGLFHFFNGISKFNIARLNSDGTLDNTFIATTNTSVRSIAVQSDGKVLIGGEFVNVNNTSKNRLARLNADGTLDATFNVGSGTNNIVTSIFIQPDGKILFGGAFSSYNSLGVNRLACLNIDGTLDSTFDIGSGPNDVVNAIDLQPDGKIFVVGNFSSYNGTTAQKIARLNTNGTLDGTFSSASGANDDILSIDIQLDGKILVGGDFTIYQNFVVPQLARLNGDGTFDSSFGLSGITIATSGIQVKSIVVQTDGKILAGGDLPVVAGFSSNQIIRLNSNGSNDNSFNVGGGANDEILTTALQPDGKILIGGYFSWYNESFKKYLARLNANGTVDTSFNASASFSDIVSSILVQPDGKILVGGWFQVYDGDSVRRLVRLNSNGTRDMSFNTGTGFNSSIYTMTLQPDGKILVGGYFTNYNGVTVGRITRLNTNGTIDNSFNCTSLANGGVNSIGLQSDGKILVGGTFGTYYGSATNKIIRLNSDGTIDLSFNVGNGFNAEVSSILVQPDDKILVGGWFTSYSNGNSTNKLTRLNTDGSRDLTFNVASGANNTILSIGLEPNGKIIIGGTFQTFNGIPSNGIARLESDGSYDPSFSIGNGFISANQYQRINSIILQPDGKKILAAGEFMQYDGFGNNRIARILNCVQTFGTQTVSACGPYTWMDGVTYTQSNNTATFNLLNSTGCDSIITLNLTILADSVIDNQTACTSYTWIDGNSYYASTDTPTVVLQNAFGCDSIIILHLTILSDSVNDTQVACNSFTWIDGNTYYSSTNTPTFVLQNVAGCDSIITLHLTILNSSLSTETESTCGSFTWPVNGQTYTSSGQYIDTIPNAAGCDSIITLDLTILNSSLSTETESTCGSFTWPINGQTFTVSGQYIDTIPNAAGCDSVITLDLTIIPSLPLTIENSFSVPSDANTCIGEVAIDLSGNAPFELDFDNGSQVITSNGYSLVTGLCAGVHDLHVTSNCGDTLSTTVVIPVDSNFVFNNPFIDSLAQDSLGVTLTNCDIYYAGIDTAYIDSIWANGNTVNVIWNIVDSNGSNFDTTSYVLNNGNGVYWLQLSVFCPNKSLEEFFTVTEAISFYNGHAGTAGLTDISDNLFEIYPNPATDQVHIHFSGPEAELTVYDAQGKVVLREHSKQ
ncbi:hypothetical protein [Fluviicola sp.]|uniref:hypothetical protein n=1 Tax=Fluviicola sp. TaxID=1917219 RepID=UPI0031D7ABC7